MKSTSLTTDFLIIGSGAAGLQAALQASRYGKVILITKSRLEASSSYLAQGGIAAVLNSKGDSLQSHKQDTLEAGRRLCNEEAVDILVEEGAQRVNELIDLGMPFDETDGSLDLSLEGGHSNRRVLHANGASTGKALVEFLTDQVQIRQNIHLVENAFVFDLSTTEEGCTGANAYCYEENELLSVQSPVTILATGGYSRLYQRSTNPHTSTGDGLWLGLNAGAELKDLEFIQFHPTALYADDETTFLISEALRGEGGYLYNSDGERFMAAYSQQELSPRDVVSKEIVNQIQQSDCNYVYLDVQHLDADALRSQFPNLIGKVEEHGINIEAEGIPVAPAAHYCIGGIATNLNAETSVDGLYACGEAAATGVHGANRLASNSLLECLVYAKRAVEHSVTHRKSNVLKTVRKTFQFKVNNSFEDQFTKLRNSVSEILSSNVGIVREKRGMKQALHTIEDWKHRLAADTSEYFSLRSNGLLQVARLITQSALERKESRGVHTRTDFPESKSTLGHISHGLTNTL